MDLQYRNVNDAFRGLIWVFKNLSDRPARGSRDGDVIQVPGPVTITYYRPRERVLFNLARDANPFFHLYESLWMLAGRNELEPMTHYVKGFGRFSDDGETINGAYGYRWRHGRNVFRSPPVDQLQAIANHLRANPNSRRAVLQMWNVEDDLLKIGDVYRCLTCDGTGKHQNGRGYEYEGADCVVCKGKGSSGDASKDVCCNLSVLFSLRPDEKDGSGRVLDMTVLNRSNDMVMGLLGANYVHFSFLQEYMAARVGAGVGKYYHFTNNLHVYLRDWKPDLWLGSVQSEYPYLPPGPVIASDPERFDREVKNFTDDFPGWNTLSASEKEIEFKEPFLETVAKPMMIAFDLHKERQYSRALEVIQQVKAPDWKAAGEAWIQKRKAVREAFK